MIVGKDRKWIDWKWPHRNISLVHSEGNFQLQILKRIELINMHTAEQFNNGFDYKEN